MKHLGYRHRNTGAAHTLQIWLPHLQYCQRLLNLKSQLSLGSWLASNTNKFDSQQHLPMFFCLLSLKFKQLVRIFHSQATSFEWTFHSGIRKNVGTSVKKNNTFLLRRNISSIFPFVVFWRPSHSSRSSSQLKSTVVQHSDVITR